jgi:outer membrane protein TolC
MERQPSLAAHQATLAAAEQGLQVIDNLRIPDCVVRELPYRRKQAQMGVTIAVAGVDLAERETVYSVTRMYLTVLYAREQLKVANDIVFNLGVTLDAAKRMVREGTGGRDLTTRNVDQLTVVLRLAETRKIQADRGVERAIAALREAIGVPPESALAVADVALPNPALHPRREDIIAWALARRGELIQASNAAAVTDLEVDAQGTTHRFKMDTFAAAADIHARPIPQGVANSEYRPGAVSLEMPTVMVGPRTARIEHARLLSSRAGAVVEKTRNLIALEAEDAFYKWEEAALKVPLTQEAAEKADTVAAAIRQDFRSGTKVKPEELITNELIVAQAKAQRNETLFQQAIALAALERVTAGGFCAGFGKLSPAMPQPPPAKGGAEGGAAPAPSLK